MEPLRKIEELQADDVARHLKRGGSAESLSNADRETARKAHEQGRMPLPAHVAGKLYDAIGPSVGRAISNARQEWERAAWGHVASHNYGEGGIHGRPEQKPVAPEPPMPDGTNPEAELARSEREATAEAFAHMKAAGAENALHEMYGQMDDPYGYQAAADRQNLGSVYETHVMREAAQMAGEREQAMRDAYLGFYQSPEMEQPGSMER